MHFSNLDLTESAMGVGLVCYPLKSYIPFGDDIGKYFYQGNTVPSSSVLGLIYLLITSQINICQNICNLQNEKQNQTTCPWCFIA